MAPKPNLYELFHEGCTNAVKLPEWQGFWFTAGNETLVFTKEDMILNTPHYEEFGSRKDYEGVNFNTDEGRELAIKFIKAVRVRTDAIRSELSQRLQGNREIASASTSLQLAFMWMGLILNEIGAANPYPKSMDIKSPVIEKHQDLAEIARVNILIENFNDLDETGVVKALRVEIQRTADILINFAQWSVPRHTKNFSYPPQMAIDKSLTEAKFWLGQQLNNIRIRQENPQY